MKFDEKKKVFREASTYKSIHYDLTGRTENELRKKIRAKKNKIDQGVFENGGNIPVKEWGRIYLDRFRKPDVGKEWGEGLETLMNFVNAIIGDKQLKNVRLTDINEIRIKLIEGKPHIKDKDHYSKEYAKKVISYTKNMFESAVDEGLIQTNPAKKLQVPRTLEKRERRALTAEERAVFLAFAEKHPHGLWIKVMIYMGLRSGEAARMRGSHIDVEKMCLFVDGTKSKKSKRRVPIPDIIFGELAPYAEQQDSLVFTTARGTALSKSSNRSRWKRFVRDLNIEKGAQVYRNEIIGGEYVAKELTPHCLRHTFASFAEEKGIPGRIISELMGHEQETTTKDYTHLTEESFLKAADLLNGKRTSFSEKKRRFKVGGKGKLRKPFSRQ
jgi:integrase